MLLRRPLAILIILGVLLTPSLLEAVSARAQGARAGGCRYFQATGHNVQGEFLAFFERYRGEETLGLPLTEELFQDGLTVQYFERARMELHPFNPPQYRVQLSLLGDLLGYRQPPIPSSSIPALDNPQRRYYPQTGHTLSYAFLQYYDTRGGLDVFGYPISEMFVANGILVQYFQRGKMEWHPENPLSSQVTLGNLGREYIAYRGLDPRYLAPAASVCSSGQAIVPAAPTAVPTPVQQPTSALAPPTAVPILQATSPPLVPTSEPTWSASQSPALPTLPASALDWDVAAWVKYPVTGQSGPQVVYVRVTDSLGRGLRDATVTAIVHFPSGNQTVRGVTDASGTGSLTFSIAYTPPGYTVMIEVHVTHGAQTKSTNTSFTVWT